MSHLLSYFGLPARTLIVLTQCSLLSACETDPIQMGSASGASMLATVGGELSGYSSTPQGKVITAAFVNTLNQTVLSLRSYQLQQNKSLLSKGRQPKVGS